MAGAVAPQQFFRVDCLQTHLSDLLGVNFYTAANVKLGFSLSTAFEAIFSNLVGKFVNLCENVTVDTVFAGFPTEHVDVSAGNGQSAPFD